MALETGRQTPSTPWKSSCCFGGEELFRCRGVRVPWRRHDANAEKKNILLLHAATGTVVKNLVCLDINREFGELVFQPQHGPGDYFLYYLPTDGPGRSKNYPVITYPPLVSTADPVWMVRNHLAQAGASMPSYHAFPQAEVVQFQSVDAFNAFFPMGVIATAAETQEVLRRHPGAMLLFPEDRSRSIRMTADLPRRWVAPGAQRPFEGNAERNEYYAMQIGAYAAQEALADIQVSYGEFRTRSGASLSSSAWTCFNTGGVDWSGRAFAHELSVEQGRIQPLWLGVQIPEDAHAGEYRGTITVSPGMHRLYRSR